MPVLLLLASLMILVSIVLLMYFGFTQVQTFHYLSGFRETFCSAPPVRPRFTGDWVECSCGRGCTSSYPCWQITAKYHETTPGASHIQRSAIIYQTYKLMWKQPRVSLQLKYVKYICIPSNKLLVSMYHFLSKELIFTLRHFPYKMF